MTIDNLLDRTWSKNYTCNEFVCEAWLQITGENLTQRLDDFLSGTGNFKQLDVPDPPCLVLLSNNNRSSTHVGLFYCDKVLHLTESGVQYVSMRSLKNYYLRFRYYEHVNHL